MAADDIEAGTITIRWRVVDASATDPDEKYEWQYEADPPIPDEVAEAILHQVRQRI